MQCQLAQLWESLACWKNVCRGCKIVCANGKIGKTQTKGETDAIAEKLYSLMDLKEDALLTQETVVTIKPSMEDLATSRLLHPVTATRRLSQLSFPKAKPASQALMTRLSQCTPVG